VPRDEVLEAGMWRLEREALNNEGALAVVRHVTLLRGRVSDLEGRCEGLARMLKGANELNSELNGLLREARLAVAGPSPGRAPTPGTAPTPSLAPTPNPSPAAAGEGRTATGEGRG